MLNETIGVDRRDDGAVHLTMESGVTLAEAFCSGVPVIVHDVLPGQEAVNLDYLQRA